jgi:hypothetical protein
MKIVWILLVCVVAAIPLRAQSPIAPQPDLTDVPIRLGPLYIDPTVSLTNLGVDTNVFNEAEDQMPKEDFTFTVTPAANMWLRAGRSWLSGRINEDLVWYQKYSGERSGNTSYNVNWTVPLNRLVFAVDGAWLNTRDRPGYEIDARSQRVEASYGGSAEVRAFSKSFLGGRVTRRHVDFDRAAEFLGSNLHDELNRTVTWAGGTFRYELTPLTSLVFSAGREEARFEFSPVRDSNSTTISGGVRFDPDALIKGTATFGYRNFRPLDPTLPPFRGATADVGLEYVAGSSTDLSMTLTRQLEYSYELEWPYFVQTGAVWQVAQQIHGPIDAVGRYGIVRLAYQALEGIDATNRNDRVHTFGGGVGYHAGRRMRIGFTIDRQERTSSLEHRRYVGLRLGTTITYGR